MTKTQTLDALLEGHEISDFSRKWVENSKTTKEKIRLAYGTLKKIGLTDDKIASQAQLLGMNPETIERNYQKLSALGLKDDKIASQAHLLGRDPETIERNYKRLSNLGLKDSKIATLAHLLGRDPETIERNYCHHVGLLRQIYEDRKSGRELLTNQAQLLGISPETINANVQYLYSLGIDYNNAFLLGTTSQLKRKKMAWLLRKVFDYRESENKRETINKMQEFVRENQQYLVKSISSLDKAKDKIRERIL